MLIVPAAALDEGVYVTRHELELELTVVNAHVALLKVPPFPPSLHVTVPVGLDGVPVLVSRTVAE